MNILLLLVLVICEVAFAVMAIMKKADKKTWKLGRLIVSAGEVLLFLVMQIIPGIDMGMRYKGLFILLILRVIVAGIAYLIERNKEDKLKKAVSMALSVVGSLVLILMAMVPSFIFADYHGLPVSGNYAVADTAGILVDASRKEAFESDGSNREVPIYFYYPENAGANDRFPIVFFSHGAFGYYQSNTSTYMELASNGYVVISVEHPYHSLFTHDTTGKIVTADREFMANTSYINSGAATEKEIMEITYAWLKLRCDDLNFVLDTVEKAVADKSLDASWNGFDEKKVLEVLNMCDCDRIGMMGHSLGGASSVEMGRERTEIDAVIDFDGTMLGEVIGVTEDGLHDIVREDEYTVPILVFDNQEHHDERLKCEADGEIYANNVLLANATDGYATCIAKTGHMNYTDLPMFSPVLGNMLGVGEVDKVACVKKMNELTLSFFDCYLKGNGSFSCEEVYEFSESGNQGQ